MKIKVPGHRVLVKPRELEKKTESGIVIVHEREEVERAAITIGKVEAVGPDAYKTMYINGYQGEPWCKVGDEVYYAKYTGKEIYDEDTDTWYRMLNDEDVIAVISKEEESNG